MTPAHTRTAIIGAGFSGIAMAIRLKQSGDHDFVILEKAEDIGGAWYHNTYPGCRCDIPSHLYSYSFAPNPEWTQAYSSQPEILDYLRACVHRFDLGPHLRTGAGMHGAAWNEADCRWELDTAVGPVIADVVVCGVGPLDEPKVPQLPGIERFRGKTMHSARWDHDYDLTGKRVASIGTGASAIQYVPEIQRQVEQLYVFQRTAPWVVPHRNHPVAEKERSRHRRFPPAQRLARARVYLEQELLLIPFAKRPKLMAKLEEVSRAHMRRFIQDPELLERVTPRYTLGCKRLLPSNRWYAALAKDNVTLVDGSVQEVREHSVVDADGVEHEVDAIIYGTGFQVADMPVSRLIRGRGGELMSDRFGGSPRAYLGTAVPGFPNFFLLLGPNTGLGHSSMVYMIESQVEHVLRTVRAMRQCGAATAEVTPALVASYNDSIDRKLRGTVWETGGCTSFYQDATGRNATLWPDWTWRFRRLAKKTGTNVYQMNRKAAPGSLLSTEPSPPTQQAR
ncbi:flavin-containing monooxygenase [Streptacidiphilus sp. PAMC 29251]